MKMKRWVIAIGMAVALGLGSAGLADDLMVMNFDSGEKLSQSAYDFGAWNKDSSDPSQGCVESFSPDEKFGDQGMSLRLDYDVESAAPAYNGVWIKVKELDISRYKFFNFAVKGDAKNGFTKVIKWEIKNPHEAGKFLFAGVTNEWQEVKIQINDFKGPRDRTKITEIVLVFDDVNSKPKMGTIYIDNIYFSTK